MKNKSLFKFFLSLIFLIYYGSSFAKTFSSCDFTLAEDLKDFSYTNNFTSYLIRLFNEGVIAVDDLQIFVDNIKKKNHMKNPLQQKAKVGSEFLYHSQTLQAYIDTEKVDAQIVLQSIQGVLEHHKIVRNKKEEAAKETKQAFSKMQFYPIHLKEHSIEMMNTLVTKAMWSSVMGGEFNVVEAEKAEIVRNWWDVAEFANQLSLQAGLQPVYDLSEKASGKVKINAPNGDIHQAEGYRMPTWLELSEVEEKFSDIVFNMNFEKYRDLPGNQMLLTDNLLPQVINGFHFYNLDAGLAEWISDIKYGEEPHDPSERYTVMKGSNNLWRDEQPAEHKSWVGFRLVKTIKSHSR